MIVLDSKINCCGCTACSQVCPKHCITMKMDEEGFKYPIVDTDQCVDCGLCEKVCPYLNSYPTPQEKPASYACKTKDDNLRAKSSSGGLFTVLATRIIHEGGVVFGAKFDAEWNVVHGYTENEDGLAAFRGSKYVQSDMGNSFSQVKEFLKAGRPVMFTGTPCQVAGLNHFLQKKYDNLFTVDFVCHCVPSPLVWRKYIEELQKNGKITGLTFKDKSEGWAKYGIKVCSSTNILAQGNHGENVYMKAFLSNLIVRPGCTNCPARHYKSGADVTMADCWGFNEYHPELNDDKGMSLALPLTEKGSILFKEVSDTLDVLQIPYIEVQEETNHKPIIESPKNHPYRNRFFQDFVVGKSSISSLMNKYLDKREKEVKRIKAIKAIIRNLIGDDLIKKIRKK